MTPGQCKAGQIVDLSRASYLIADKNKFTRNLVSRTLRNFSATDVRETSDFATALNMIQERPPEAIFLSLGPDWIDERDFLKALRRITGASPHIPAIALSQSACSEEIAIAVALGVDSHITIPFSAATVEAHLIRILEGSRSDRLHG